MDWYQEVEIQNGSDKPAVITLAELCSLLMVDLTREELDEFAGELITYVELFPGTEGT